MRLFLDAHISGKRIATALRTAGHDVRAADEERELDDLDDAPLFAIARADDRILVTSNVKDFMPILREWAEAETSRAGCIFISSNIRHEHFGMIIAGIKHALTETSDQQDWTDRVHWLSR